jgi:thiamine biosynthesis protein ThiS
MQLNLLLDGESQSVRLPALEPVTLTDIINALTLQPGQLAIRINDRYLRRAEVANTQILPSDKIEFIRIVAGG